MATKSSKVTLKKSRLWAARQNVSVAKRERLDAHQKAGWTINNRAKKPEYNDMYQSAKRNYQRATDALKAETKRAKAYAKRK